MKASLSRLCSLLACLSVVSPCIGAALSSAFTYQGRLLNGGAAGNGTYDFEFTLHSLPTGGVLTAGPIRLEDVPVTNGLFTVELDFGASAFASDARWLAMGVRVGASNSVPFFPLPTRQALTAVPQAQFALAAGTVLDGAITAGKIATGQVVKSLNGLKDDVVLEAGNNVTLSTDGNRLRIAAAGGGGSADPAQIMSAVRANDGLGSGLDADLIDGIDSVNLALKTEVQGRVLKGGDTMTGKLGIVHPGGLTALEVNSSASRNSAQQLAYFNNSDTSANAAPAIRAENTGGTATNGTLQVVNRGSGYIARFGTGINEHVASLDTSGALRMDASVASGTQSVLDVRNNGNGRLATFGNATEGKLWIDKDGNLTTATGYVNAPGGLLTSGNLFIGGEATVKVLTITGGADIAEPFQMSHEKAIPAGAVVVIDEENSGHLKMSGQAYDKRVAGIVSGANGINPGLALHQQGVVEGGQNIALSGRVYVRGDATESPIKPGDLLTTSSRAGHAMAVRDFERAQGAILGKAMSGLDTGQGMVLVLVTLQ
jgi:hypothetical protein